MVAELTWEEKHPSDYRVRKFHVTKFMNAKEEPMENTLKMAINAEEIQEKHTLKVGDRVYLKRNKVTALILEMEDDSITYLTPNGIKKYKDARPVWYPRLQAVSNAVESMNISLSEVVGWYVNSYSLWDLGLEARPTNTYEILFQFYMKRVYKKKWNGETWEGA